MFQRSRLHNQFGSYEPSLFTTVLALSSDLAKWRASQTLNGDATVDVRDEPTEFGADLDFSFDSNFLLDIFVSQAQPKPQQSPKAAQQQQGGRRKNNKGNNKGQQDQSTCTHSSPPPSNRGI